MLFLPCIVEPVPADEVAGVLAEAASRVRGGPPAYVAVSGHQLAAALQLAGFQVVRVPAPGAQLTL